jgi:arylsulfatase A-like enzyme
MFSATEAKLAEHLSERGIPSVLRRHTALLTTRYDGEVRYTDAQLGRFLDGLREQGRYESSVIALAGDHGEGLYEHGDPAHEFLWRATLAVPLILRWPGGPRGVRSSRLASLVDVLPTLRAHTRLPLSAGAFDGRDLLAGEEGFVLSQEPVQASAPRQRTHALTTKDWKYWRLSDAPDRLYHLAEDPLETRNVIEEWPEDAARLRARLDELLAVARSKPGIEVSDDIDPALRARLRALGYAE